MAFLFVIVIAASASAAPNDVLFDPPAGRSAIGGGPPWARAGLVTRQRPAAARVDLLTRIGPGQRIVLNLFDDASFGATVSAVERHGANGLTWRAALDGIDGGHALLSVHGGALVGSVVMPGAVYRIGYAPDGSQLIEQVDTSVLPPEAEPLVPPPARALDRAPDAAADSGAQIDVMVLYTAAARAAAGGTAAMQAEVNAAVASANQAYATNGLVQRLRLVFSGEVSIRESDFGIDLDTLQSSATVASLRNAYGADLVSLLTDHGPSAAFCGIGFVLVETSTAYAPYGFSVVERDCATGNLSFAHELGHNMGAQHDLHVTSLDSGLFQYSHGFVDLTGRFRTIMAYPTQCAEAGFSCTRIAAFSTPNRTFNGRPIGNATTADNARTLAESAQTVANFRQAVTGPPSTFADVPATSPFWSSVEALVAAGITSGCATTPPLFCPDAAVTRGQMAVFLLKGMAYPGAAAPDAPAGNVFADVSASTPFAAWIEGLYATGVTGGCLTSPLLYCPDQMVTRGQMAVFLLRARHGAGYTPPAPVQQSFADVPLDHPLAGFIQQLAAEGITGGCATGPARYCPDSPVTRAQMAVFLVRAFNLPL